MQSNKNVAAGLITALISFLLGTAIFWAYYSTSDANWLFFGWGFVVVAGLVNLILLAVILKSSITDSRNRSKLLFTAVAMVLNIPVMLIYGWVTMGLLNTMRITLTNSTDDPITHINIIGCEPTHIDRLEKGEVTTVWVGITGDCSLNIEYMQNDSLKNEMMVGYVTSSMGQKIDYNIGGDNTEMF